MKKEAADAVITGYMKKLFGFAVSKTRSLSEAEELSSEIVIEVYQSLLRQDDIVNLDGYVYRIAKNVHARFLREKYQGTAVDGIEFLPDGKDMAEDLQNDETCGLLRREITYLSKIQREIIVLHYFHELKIREIAQKLSIPENTVKWHLACSRKELKTGMEKIRTTGTLGTKPIRFSDMGHGGTPGSKGDTSDFLAKSLTQNIAYAAYHQPRTVNEIAEELGVNPIFVEDEVSVLEEYGFMDKLPGGKYRTNIQIYIPNEKIDEVHRKIDPKYTKLFAEKFFAPVLEKITEIPDWLTVPENDVNLLKWAMVDFLSDRLKTADLNDRKYSVKRPDGGDYIAYATLAEDNPSNDEKRKNKYWACGDMWRDNFENGIWWKSWQLDCFWTNRTGGWRDNMNEDYDKLYYFLKGELPESPINAESYQRLLDKGYLLKKDGGYRCNIILSESEQKWWEFIPQAPEEITALSREYAEKSAEAEIIGQPAHMLDQIKYNIQNAACMLTTRIMEELINIGVLKEPTSEQCKGLLTIMFLGK